MIENFIRYEISDNVVLAVTEIITEKQIVERRQHHTFVKHIKALISKNIITFSFETWQGETLPFEPINIKISGQEIESIVLTLEEPELELNGTGLVTIETLNGGVKNIKMVVEL